MTSPACAQTFFLPETYAPTLLLRRAERLRKLTGNNLIKTRWELENPEGQSVLRMGTNQIKMAFRLSMEPIVLYSNVYIGLLYVRLSLARVNEDQALTFSTRAGCLLPVVRGAPLSARSPVDSLFAY